MACARTERLKTLALASGALIAIAYGAAFAQSERKIEFTIEAQELGGALNAFGVQSGKEVYYRDADIAGKRSDRLAGEYSTDEAITLLLDDTGVPYRDNGAGVILVGEAYIRQASLREKEGPFRLAQADTQASGAVASVERETKKEVIADVVVTARKRQESILKVPVVETVLTKEALDKQQVIDLTDIASQVPGLGLGSSVLTIGTQVSLRGVGTSTLDAGVDQSVSLNIDGLQLGQGLAYRSGVFDLAQVEVLKGPQALFYGKSSPGGVIALHTADPGSEVEIIGRTGYEFEADESRSELILSGPVSDTLGLRLATMYSDQEGFYRNAAVALPEFGAANPRDRRFGDTESLITRATARWEPSSEFDARLKMSYARDRNTGGPAVQIISCPEGTGPVAPLNIPFLAGEDCKLDRKIRIVDLDPAAFPNVPNDGVPFLDQTQKFGALELNFRPDPSLTLTSTSGYYHLDADGMINATLSTAAGPPYATENLAYREDFTQELRLNSDFSGPLNFTVGGFYQDGEFSNTLLLIGNARYGLPPTVVHQKSTLDIEATSLFGQLRWQIAPKLEIAGGARWSDERRSDKAWNLVTGAPVAIPLTVSKISSDNWSPEFTATYTPTDDFTVYGSLKQAYKSGSFSVSRIVGPGADPSFGDEKVRGGELGLKARTTDRSLFANLAGYYYDYEGLQVGVTEAVVGGVPQNRTLNAGSAEIYGVDFDLTYRPQTIDGLSLRAALNWNHARFTDLRNVPCTGGQTIAEGCNLILNPVTGRFTAQDLTGTPLVRAPNWQATSGFDYDVPIGSGMVVALGADGQYSSKYPTQLSSRRDSDQPGFTKLNANVTLRGPQDKWQVAMIGNNLTNELTNGNCTISNAAGGAQFGPQITGGTQSGAAGKDEAACRPDRGREMWLRLTLRL